MPYRVNGEDPFRLVLRFPVVEIDEEKHDSLHIEDDHSQCERRHNTERYNVTAVKAWNEDYIGYTCTTS